MNTLSNIDLMTLAKHMDIPLKNVYSKDKLPYPLPVGCYIINLQSSGDGMGTHWTAILVTSDMTYYFDAFGEPAPTNLPTPYYYDNKQIQNIDTSSCGFYCLGFLKFMSQFTNKLMGYKMFDKLFSNDTTKNEGILFSLLYSR
jgi:hypothetical protein